VSGDALPQRKGDCGGPRWRNRRRDPKRILGNATRKNIDRRRQTNPTSVILSEVGFALARSPRVEGPRACRKRQERGEAFSRCFVQSLVGTPCGAVAAAHGYGLLRLRECFASRSIHSAQDDSFCGAIPSQNAHFGKSHNKNIDRRRQTNPTSVILSEAGFALARGLRVEGPHACRKRHERCEAFSRCFVQKRHDNALQCRCCRMRAWAPSTA
jgi:hypothetical protein